MTYRQWKALEEARIYLHDNWQMQILFEASEQLFKLLQNAR